MRVGYSFFAGVLLYRLFLSRTRSSTRLAKAQFPAWGILAAVAAILLAAPSVWLRPIYDFIIVVAVFPLLIYASLHVQTAGASERIFRFLGATSYAVYIIHAPMSLLAEGILQRTWLLRVQDYRPWTGLAFLTLLLSLCWLLDRVYDAPVRRYLLKQFKISFGRILAGLWLMAGIVDVWLFWR